MVTFLPLRMSKTDQPPRAIIHQNILDAAAEKPNATLESIATEVSGATPEFVERVLNEYGDPGEDEEPTDEAESDLDQAATGPDQAESAPVEESRPATEDLTPMQRDIIEAIHESPSASQRDLASRFDVATSTINRQVNSIPDFDWGEREQFVSEHFDSPTNSVTPEPKAKSNGSQRTESTDLSDRVRRLEDRLEAAERPESAMPDGFEDPELVHKVLRACLRDDGITEEEELRIISNLVQ